MNSVKKFLAASACALGVFVAGMTLNTTVAPQVAVAAGIDGQVKPLRGATPVDQQDPAPQLYGTVEGAAFEKAYRQQPPLIPHRVDKYEVDLKTNQCLTCHDWPQNTQFNAPKVSETHYVDRQGVRLDNVARTRWFCNQCHVPQSDAPELVDNVFQPAVK